MNRIFFSILLLFTTTFSEGSGFEFTANCREAYNEMLQLDFNAANGYLGKEKSINPGNAAVPYIEQYIDFLKAFISEEDRYYASVKNNFDNRLDFVEKNGSGSPWMNLARGEMILQLAMLKLKRKEYISAGYYTRRAYKLLEENQKHYPGFLPNLKALGFFHSIIGAIPENYKWLSNLAGFRGTIEQGGNELSQLITGIENTNEFSFLSTEAAFLKIFIATHLEKDYKAAFSTIEKIKSKNILNNPLFAFLHANTFIISGNPSEGLKILSSYSPAKDLFNLHYLEYITGILKLNNLDYASAKHFIRFTESYKGKSFIKSAYHKLAWISLLKNDTTGYRNYMEKVILYGNDFTDEDKQALKDARSGELPNLFLLRSRLLFDGGNYNGALTELAGKPSGNFIKFKDQLEYTYRLARIFDKKGQTEKAIRYYTTTYENGMRSEWYFAANAALNNGILYEAQGDKSRALEWYKKCLDLRNHEYQNSIDHKAEAGINRVNN